MTQSPNPESETQPDIEKIVADAEDLFRKGMDTIGEWGDEARNLLENRPGVVLASISIAGFMTGYLLRRGVPLRKMRSQFGADPTMIFVSGAIAGLLLGPKLVGGTTAQESRSGKRASAS